MDKATIVIKEIKKEDNSKIKIIADITNSGDTPWTVGGNIYRFRGHFITYEGGYINDPYCENANIVATVDVGETIEKTIYLRSAGVLRSTKFWHPENVIILDIVQEGVEWFRNDVSFKIKDITEGVQLIEYTTSELITGEETQIELDIKEKLIELQHLRIEPIGDFNPCYGDDFTTLDNWNQFNGSYIIEENAAKLVTTENWVDLINNNLDTVTNSTVEVSSKLLNVTQGGYFGILFSYIDASNYWRVSVRCNNGNYLCIYHYVNGVNQSADYYYVGYTITANRWTNLKLDLINNTVKVYIDNSLMFEYSNNQIVPGKVGITAYKLGTQQVWLDDFLVGSGVYNSYLYNKFIELPLISKINKSKAIDIINSRTLSCIDKKLRLKILNNGANNTFKITGHYKKIK